MLYEKTKKKEKKRKKKKKVNAASIERVTSLVKCRVTFYLVFSVAHAQNILPDRVTSGHVTDVTDVTSGHAQWSDPPHDPPQMLICPYPYTTLLH